MMISGTTLIQHFERFASPQLAEKWDHVGLQVGDPDRPIKKLMTTLDTRPETVQEAIDQGVDFIFAHHPAMFHPAKDLDTRNPQNAMYAQLLAQLPAILSVAVLLVSPVSGSYRYAMPMIFLLPFLIGLRLLPGPSAPTAAGEAAGEGGGSPKN